MGIPAHMKVQTFDKLAGTVLVLSVLYSVIVALSSWEWFPTPGDWGDIAHIPPNMMNYIALLLVPSLLLAYLLIRRWCFKKEL